MPQRTPCVSLRDCVQLSWSSHTGVTTQPSPPHTGTSNEALRVRVERGNGSSGQVGTHHKKGCRATGEQLQSSRTDLTLAAMWKRTCHLQNPKRQVTHVVLRTSQFVPPWMTTAPPSDILKIPKTEKLKPPSKQNNVLSCGDLSTSNVRKLPRKIAIKAPNVKEDN